MYATERWCRNQTLCDVSKDQRNANCTCFPQAEAKADSEPSEGVQEPPNAFAPPDSSVCRSRLCAVLFVRLQAVVLLVQPLQGNLAIRGQIWSANGCDCAGEESRLPLLVSFLALCCLLPLLLLDLSLESCGLAVLPFDDGVGDTFPELE